MLSISPEIDLVGDENTTSPIAYERVEFKDEIYFRKHDARYGIEHWKTDGTSEGTKLVKDIAAGPASSITLEVPNGARMGTVANRCGDDRSESSLESDRLEWNLIRTRERLAAGP